MHNWMGCSMQHTKKHYFVFEELLDPTKEKLHVFSIDAMCFFGCLRYVRHVYQAAGTCTICKL